MRYRPGHPSPPREIAGRAIALDAQGAGIVELDDRRVHVTGALPGEHVVARVEHVSPHAPGDAWARLLEVVEAAPSRAAPVCPAYGRCGGCTLQHLAYGAQLAWKRERVREALAAAGVAPELVAPCAPSPRVVGYRNQAKYVVGRSPGGGVVLGAFAPRTHDLIDLAGCALLEPPLDAVAGKLRELLDAAGVRPFDERRRTGSLRYAVLRASHEGRVLVTLITPRPELPEGAALARALRAAFPEVAGVVHNFNPTAGNALFGDAEDCLAGQPFLDDRVGDVPVRLASRSFFQLNRDVAALAYAEITAVAAATGVHRAVDAYAGAGGIAFALAARGVTVTAIEDNPAATATAAAFARERDMTGVTFVTGDVEEMLAPVGRVDLVVLNPPRRGCAPAVLAATTAATDRAIYLSCDPDTLARDLATLRSLGLAPERVAPFDMLPHTPHVEALVVVARAH